MLVKISFMDAPQFLDPLVFAQHGSQRLAEIHDGRRQLPGGRRLALLHFLEKSDQFPTKTVEDIECGPESLA